MISWCWTGAARTALDTGADHEHIFPLKDARVKKFLVPETEIDNDVLVIDGPDAAFAEALVHDRTSDLELLPRFSHGCSLDLIFNRFLHGSGRSPLPCRNLLPSRPDSRFRLNLNDSIPSTDSGACIGIDTCIFQR